MYKYRLTRLGKVVAAALTVILLIVISSISMEMMATARNSSTDRAPSESMNSQGSGFTCADSQGQNPGIKHDESNISVEDHIIENKQKTSVSEESNGNHTAEGNGKDEILSINAEEVYEDKGRKVAFLTFDDGPSSNITPQILHILKKYNIRATFFVLGSLCKKNAAIIREMADDGHAIGIHTYSHNYKTVYKSAENFINEIKMTEAVLKQILGEKFNGRLFRFPGGSFESYKKQYKKLLYEAGMVSIDWNVITGDAEASNLPPEKLLDRLKSTSKGKNNIIVLMHDSSNKQTTADVLPEAIEYLKSQGYEFALLR